MDGAVAECELTSGVSYRVATRADDAGIRRLLRSTPMRGKISLSMEREPSYFDAAAIEGPEHRTVIAIENDRVIASGSVTVRERYINGQPMRVGYLGGLRLDASARGRVSVIKRGYELLLELHRDGGPTLYFTSIIADNLPARRLLERGLSGLPTYRFVGEFVTLIIRRRRRSDFFKPTALVRRRLRENGFRIQYGDDALAPAIADLLNFDHRQYQLAPVYTVQNLRGPGLQFQDFRIACTSDNTAAACAAFWDQRSIKQTVVRDYSPRLRRLRPLLNAAAAVVGRPRLPAIGEAISNAFVSHVATDPRRPELVELLIDLLHGPAHTRRIDYLTIGFDARDPRLAHLRRVFHAREYVSRLYAVHWDDGADLARSLDARLLAPGVALL